MNSAAVDKYNTIQSRGTSVGTALGCTEPAAGSAPGIAGKGHRIKGQSDGRVVTGG